MRDIKIKIAHKLSKEGKMKVAQIINKRKIKALKSLAHPTTDEEDRLKVVKAQYKILKGLGIKDNQLQVKGLQFAASQFPVSI